MNYNKPPKTFSQQANLLMKRGLIVQSTQDLIDYLKQVNYYRLSGYLYTFKTTDPKTGKEKYKSGTTLEKIKERYDFDRKLRLLIMDAIERVEVGVLRTLLVEVNSTQYGPFGYTDIKNYDPNISVADFHYLLVNVLKDEKRGKELFHKRYRKKYTTEKYLPIWMAVELMSFGELFTFYKNQDIQIKKVVSGELNIGPPVLDSWLHTLLYARNSSAHHARIWNQIISIKPKIPYNTHNPEWHSPSKVNNDRIFVVLSILSYLLDIICPTSSWKQRVKDLILNHPNIPLQSMGFTQDWEKYQFWKI